MSFMEFSGLTRIASARELNHPSHRWSLKWAPVLHQPLLASLLRSWLLTVGVTPRGNEKGIPIIQWWNPDLDPSDVVGKGWVFFGSSKATPDPPTVSVSSSTNTQIDLAWTPGLVFRWNLEMAMGDVCFFVVRYLFFNSNTHSDHGEQYDFVFLLWTFESKLKTYYFHIDPWHSMTYMVNFAKRRAENHSMSFHGRWRSSQRWQVLMVAQRSQDGTSMVRRSLPLSWSLGFTFPQGPRDHLKVMDMYWKIPCVIHVCVLWQWQGKAVFYMFDIESSTVQFICCAKDGITWTAASSPQCPWLSVNKFISFFHPNIDSHQVYCWKWFNLYANLGLLLGGLGQFWCVFFVWLDKLIKS